MHATGAPRRAKAHLSQVRLLFKRLVLAKFAPAGYADRYAIWGLEIAGETQAGRRITGPVHLSHQ
jgi:hypothetical protein